MRLKVGTEALREARAEAERLLAGCEGSCVSLMAALAVRTSPDYAPRTEGGMQKVAERITSANSVRMGGKKPMTAVPSRMSVESRGSERIGTADGTPDKIVHVG